MPVPTLPSHVSIKSLCDSFSSHFKNKVNQINHILNPEQVDSPQVNSLLASFSPATVDEVRTIIMSESFS